MPHVPDCVPMTKALPHLAKFREQQDGTDERLSRLLGRKVEKSRLGEGLVRDIEVLVKEVDLVANVL